MDNHYSPSTGIISSIVSIMGAVIAWISMQQAQMIITLLASLVGLASGLLAARYYWYAAKEKKITIKNNKNARI